MYLANIEGRAVFLTPRTWFPVFQAKSAFREAALSSTMPWPWLGIRIRTQWKTEPAPRFITPVIASRYAMLEISTRQCYHGLKFVSKDVQLISSVTQLQSKLRAPNPK